MTDRSVRIPLTLKILSIAICMLIILISIAFFSHNRLSKVKEELDYLAVYLIPIADTVTRVYEQVLEQEIHFERLLKAYNSATKSRGQIRDEISRFDARDEAIHQAVADAFVLAGEFDETDEKYPESGRVSEIVPALQRIATRHETLDLHTRRILDLLKTKDSDKIQATVLRMEDERSRFDREIEEIQRWLQLDNQSTVVRTRQHQRQVLHFNALMTAIATIAGLLFAYILTSGLVRPIHDLMTAMNCVGKGNLDVVIRRLSRDEIGELAETFRGMVDELILKEKIKETFGKYVDQRVVSNLIDQPDSLKTGGIEQEMTVMFSDLTGFEEIAKTLTPESAIDLTNQYLTFMSEPVSRHQGVLDKYIDSTVMAFWGPPFVDKTEHAQKACAAVWGQVSRLNPIVKLIRSFVNDGDVLPKFDFNVGLSTGSLVVGNMGSDQAQSYTVLGDTVNVASRLKGISKQYGIRVAISEATRAMAGKAIEVREIDLIRVVGKDEPLRVYELLGEPGQISGSLLAFRNRFEDGLAAYRHWDWGRAADLFEQCRKEKPDDKPTKIYIERVAQLRTEPPDDSWDGVWQLTKK